MLFFLSSTGKTLATTTRLILPFICSNQAAGYGPCDRSFKHCCTVTHGRRDTYSSMHESQNTGTRIHNHLFPFDSHNLVDSASFYVRNIMILRKDCVFWYFLEEQGLCISIDCSSGIAKKSPTASVSFMYPRNTFMSSLAPSNGFLCTATHVPWRGAMVMA